MEFVIITGMSGAGKTGALHVLEDIGYYCVDNLPSSLLSTLYRLCLKSEDDSMKRVAVVVDVRGNEKFEEMCSQIEHFKMHYENVIGEHLQMLSDEPDMQELYRLISESIHRQNS